MEFTEVEKKLTRHEINDLENKYEIKFPSEYIDHLLKFNGGRVEPNVFSFLEYEKLTTSMIDWFLAIYDGEYDNLEIYINSYLGRLEQKIIPIAHDPGGNLICISCKEEDCGKIYFWDHEKEGQNEAMILINLSCVDLIKSKCKDKNKHF